MNLYAVAALAAAEPFNKDDVKPGWVALGIVVVLCFATFVLALSFLRHAKKAQQPWDGDSDPGRTTPHNRG
jgi:hypothetical protein